MTEKKTAIVIEDDENILYLVEFILENQGYTVTTADDGEKATVLLDSSTPPSVVLMDYMLPFRDGVSLVRHLRKKPAWKNVPVLMLTSKSQAEDISAALDAGASDYMIKPFEPMDLIKRVQRIRTEK